MLTEARFQSQEEMVDEAELRDAELIFVQSRGQNIKSLAFVSDSQSS